MQVNFNQSNYFFYDQLAAESAASEILQMQWDSGDTPEHKIDNITLKDSEYKGWSVTQGQGSRALREKVVEVLEKTKSFHGLSPKALRAAREKNPKLFTIFQSKHISHEFGFKGPFVMQDGSELDLESFHEVFALPMLGSSLSSWAVNPKEQEKAAKIGEILSNALFHDSLDETKIQKALSDFHNGIPIIVSSGWIWHSTQVLLIQGQTEDENYLIYNNRGADCESGGAISGWNVYKIGKISESLIKRLSSRLAHNKSDYLSCKMLVEEFGATLIFKHSMKTQKVGNCTYLSLKAAISAIIAIWEITNGFQQKLTDESFLQLSKSGVWKDSYKSFSNAGKELLLRDFLIDLKENSVTTNQALSTLANLIYKKLTDSPIFGFKIGWDLWLEVVELCECAFPDLKSLALPLRTLVNQFIGEDSDRSINLNHLVELIFHFANKKDDQKLNDCIGLLKTFMSKGKGLEEAEKVVLKLMSYEEHKFTDLAINLLKALMENGGVYLEQSYSILLKAQKNNELWSICSEFSGIVQMLAMDGKLEIIKNWFLNDPELIESILEPAFRNLILQPAINNLFKINQLSPILKEPHKRLDAAMQLMPFLSSKIYENNATMRELCSQLIKVELWKDAKMLAINLQNPLRNSVLSRYIDFLIKKKLWKEAYAEIQVIEGDSVQTDRLDDLFNALTDEQLWDEAKAILSEISKLEGNCYTYSYALGNFCLSLGRAKMWQEAKIAFEKIMKIESKYRPSSYLSAYSMRLSSVGMFDDALIVAESIESDYFEKASALKELSIKLEFANELQRAQEVKLLSEQASSIFQKQILSIYTSK